MITLILGNVPLLQDRVLVRMRKEREGDDSQSFFGSECKAKAILDACANLSLLGAAPFVLLRAADRLPRREQEILRKYLKTIPAEASLVLMADKIDRRLKLWQEIVAIADVVSVEAPPAKERRGWLQQEAKRRGLRVASDAFPVLAETGLADFNQALLLLEKLELYCADRKDVDWDTMERCRIGGSPAKIFEWADAVGGGDWSRALLILQSLWSGQESPLAVLALLVRHYRILLKAVENRSLWGRRQELARIMGVPPFVVDRYLQQARNYTRPHLLSLWKALQSTDRSLKSSPIKKELELESLFWNLKQQTAA